MNLRLLSASCTLVGGLVLSVLLPAASAHADAEDDFKLARNLFRNDGDYATSATLFAGFIRDYPGNPHLAEARLLLARSFARSRRCVDAVPAFESFYDQHSDHLDAAEARRERADCLTILGEFSRAASGLEEVQRLYSESPFAAGALLGAASNFARAGDLPNAVRAYDKLLTNYASKPEARRGRYRLAQLRFAAGDATSALTLLASISQSAPRSDEARDALLLSGNIDLVLNHATGAEATFDRLHETFAGSAHSDSAYLDLAGFYMGGTRYNDAIAGYERAIEAIRNDTLAARACLGHADALRLTGQAAESLSEYSELVASGSPVREPARLGQAIALGQTGRFGAAVGLFLQLVQAPSGGPPSSVAVAAVRELGALYRRQGDLPRASSWFRRYLDDGERYGATFPESAAERDLVRLQLAQVLDASGYHDDAVRRFGNLSRSLGPLAGEAQYGLAVAYEGAGSQRLAIGEYGAFLERYPGNPRAAQVRQRIEYLREYTIVDADRLARALQQIYVDELSGTARQQSRLQAARALRDHQDFDSAVRAWETYVGAYPNDATTAEAQFYLADCLYRLSRQRQLEGNEAAADSLHALALQEDRILAAADAGRWSRLARLRRVESTAATMSDTARSRVLETGYSGFLLDHPLSDETADGRARALLGLADSRRLSAAADSTKLGEADQAYSQMLTEAPVSPLAPRARFGRAVVALERSMTAAAIDSLSTLLPTLPGTSLQPEALATLGVALARAGRHGEAATRLGELLLAFPDYEGRRIAQELLGDTYLALGDATRAAELFATLAESDPQGDVDGSLRRRLARAQQLRGNPGAALIIYDRLLSKGAGAADSLQVARGRVLAGLGREEEAVAAFGQVQRGALLPEAQLGAADLHFAAGRFEPAAAAYAPLLNGDIDAGVMGRAVACLYELGRVDEAEEMADRHRKLFGKEGVWPYLFRLYEGRYLLARREYDKAQKVFESVAEDAADRLATADVGSGVPVIMRRMAADPVSSGVFFGATAQWEKMRAEPTEEGTAKALQAQANFAAQYPDSPFAADIHMRLAEFHLALGHLRPAAGAFRRVADGAHSTLIQKQEAVWQLEQCYSRLFEWDEALKISRLIQTEFPAHPKTSYLQLEIGYLLKEMGQHAEAIAALTKVLEWAEGEDAAEARLYIGQSYQHTGDYRKAIHAFYKVAFYGAGASTQWINTADFQRARCHEKLGEFDTARNIYQRIILRDGGGSELGRFARQNIDLLPSSPDGTMASP